MAQCSPSISGVRMRINYVDMEHAFSTTYQGLALSAPHENLKKYFHIDCLFVLARLVGISVSAWLMI